MKINRVLVTGDRSFINRYHFLFDCLSSEWGQIDDLPMDNLYHLTWLRSLVKQIYRKIPFLSAASTNRLISKNAPAFIKKSRQTEQKIRQLQSPPDLVFHLFSMFSPFWDKFDIPYVLYLDYTMALSQQNWEPWALTTEDAIAEWLNCERRSYQNAHHIFTMGTCVKTSLIKDYGVDPDRITAIGSGGQFLMPYQGKKNIGSQQILFNGSDFDRKGGDLLVEAFQQVRQHLPNAKLVIVGAKLPIDQDSIQTFDYISSRSVMEQLFLDSDLVVSPARCDPFQCFLVEAMNYGVPCIVSDRDGMTEIVDHGVNGIVLAQPTPALLATKIIELLSDPTTLRQMSDNARLKVQTQFTWNVIAKKILGTIAGLETDQEPALLFKEKQEI